MVGIWVNLLGLSQVDRGKLVTIATIGIFTVRGDIGEELVGLASIYRKLVSLMIKSASE